MSLTDAITVFFAYPLQIIFSFGAVYLAFEGKYDRAAFWMSFSIMLLLLARLQ
ncbi:hypothetical protein [Castellaniella sp.]|uniref:hypothetical protein n=1 Tax=Castellaniella sp. TaxID=1955812 RepID=UPI002AFFD42F|nr:hypothetical protein [Castellaniella sp.]